MDGVDKEWRASRQHRQSCQTEVAPHDNGVEEAKRMGGSLRDGICLVKYPDERSTRERDDKMDGGWRGVEVNKSERYER